MCVVFIEACVGMEITLHVESILSRSKIAFDILRSDTADDNAKETAAREASFVVFRETAHFTLKVLLIVFSLLFLYWATAEITGMHQDEFIAAATSITTLVVFLVLGTMYAKLRYVSYKRL